MRNDRLFRLGSLLRRMAFAGMRAPELQTELSGGVLAAFQTRAALRSRSLRAHSGTTECRLTLDIWLRSDPAATEIREDEPGRAVKAEQRACVRACRAQQRCQVHGLSQVAPATPKSGGCGASQRALINS